MGKHDHKECEHDLKYCSKCDVVYCENCNKEWRNYRISYPYPSAYQTYSDEHGTSGVPPQNISISNHHHNS